MAWSFVYLHFVFSHKWDRPLQQQKCLSECDQDMAALGVGTMKSLPAYTDTQILAWRIIIYHIIINDIFVYFYNTKSWCVHNHLLSCHNGARGWFWRHVTTDSGWLEGEGNNRNRWGTGFCLTLVLYLSHCRWWIHVFGLLNINIAATGQSHKQKTGYTLETFA